MGLGVGEHLHHAVGIDKPCLRRQPSSTTTTLLYHNSIVTVISVVSIPSSIIMAISHIDTP